jgi:transposase
MANLLKMAMIETIRTLHRRGWSQRRIAAELGINRETVARYLRQAVSESKPATAPTGSHDDHRESKPATAPTGSHDDHRESKPATAPTGSESGDDPLEQVIATPASVPDRPSFGRYQPSGCEPWRVAIQAKCDLGLTAQRIYQDLVSDHGFTGSYYSVRRFVRRLEQSHELPFRRVECDPGDEAQVDFGEGLSGRAFRTPINLGDGIDDTHQLARLVLRSGDSPKRKARGLSGHPST